MFGLFSSLGVKRLIASHLLSIAVVLKGSNDPSAVLLVSLFEQAAAFFGATGLAQASITKGSLGRYVFASLGALLALAQYIPLLQPYLSILNQASIILTGAAVGQKVGEKKKEKQLLKLNPSIIQNKNL